MTDFQRLIIKKYPRIETGYTNEYYWKKFKVNYNKIFKFLKLINIQILISIVLQ